MKNNRIDELIMMINKFSKLSKERDLTKDETIEREKIRKEYISIFKESFEQSLQSIEIIDKTKN